MLIDNGKTGEIGYYQEKLKKLNGFRFENYKSSQYGSLARDLYDLF